jgi:hypothetical protein
MTHSVLLLNLPASHMAPLVDRKWMVEHTKVQNRITDRESGRQLPR